MADRKRAKVVFGLKALPFGLGGRPSAGFRAFMGWLLNEHFVPRSDLPGSALERCSRQDSGRRPDGLRPG
jgi:hypothetical protein